MGARSVEKLEEREQDCSRHSSSAFLQSRVEKVSLSIYSWTPARAGLFTGEMNFPHP